MIPFVLLFVGPLLAVVLVIGLISPFRGVELRSYHWVRAPATP